MQVQAAPLVMYSTDTAEYCQPTTPLECIAHVVFAVMAALCLFLSPVALDPLGYFGFYKVGHVCLLPHCDAFPTFCSGCSGMKDAYIMCLLIYTAVKMSPVTLGVLPGVIAKIRSVISNFSDQNQMHKQSTNVDAPQQYMCAYSCCGGGAGQPAWLVHQQHFP